MFSWLGFGQSEEKANVVENIEQAEELEQTLSDDVIDEIKDDSFNESVELADDVEVAVEQADNDLLSTPVTEGTIPKEAIAIEPKGDVSSDSEINETEALELSAPKESAPEELALPSFNVAASETDQLEQVIEKSSEAKLSLFARLKKGLTKTRQNLGGGLFDLFRGKQIDDDLFEELETHLLLADVGVETTMKIIDSLTQSASRKQLKDASALYDLLKIELQKIIVDVSKPLDITQTDGPFVILMVGVNGVGKTTTIGKLAKQFQAEGKSVMLAAGDTFRAAAVEQLQVWGDRNDIPVIAQHTGADSASVIFDAISAAKARKVDVLIADTAGRLQNKAHLMEELKKVVRVMKKLDVKAPHEVMLTLDAGTGQNALSQTKLFDEAVGLTGLTLTKLDGTAKGGVVFAVADKHNIPIRYLGVGEGIDDLRPFNGDDFIDALFSK
jgi:fused signal recognition particle receptor